MNESILKSLSEDELLRYVDRKDPFVDELATRLEEILDILDEFENGRPKAAESKTA